MTRALKVPEIKKVSVKKVPMEKSNSFSPKSPSIGRVPKAGAGPELDERAIRPVSNLKGERISGSKINPVAYHGLDVNAHMGMK